MFTKALLLIAASLAAAQCEPSSSSSSKTPPSSSSSATPPTNTGVAIHPNGNNAKCLDVQANNVANGTPVQVYDCNGTTAQKWLIGKGNGKVRLASNPNYCLDMGTNIVNGAKGKIWQCYDGLPQQQFYWTLDNRIALTGQGQCLDLPGGAAGGAGQASSQIQIWQCATGNTNQVWTTNANGQRRRYIRYSDSEE